MVKAVSHIVKRPGRLDGDPDVEIPVAEDLATGPGSPQRPQDVAFYSREYPLETQSIEKSADRPWAWATQPDDLTEFRKIQDERMEPMYAAALASGDVQPTGTQAPGEDLTEDLRRLARELGFGEVGFTKYDRHYTSPGRSTGPSLSMPSAWPWSRTTIRPRQGPAWRPSTRTTRPTRSRKTCT